MSKLRTPKNPNPQPKQAPAKAVSGRGAASLGRQNNPLNWKGGQVRKPMRAEGLIRKYER